MFVQDTRERGKLMSMEAPFSHLYFHSTKAVSPAYSISSTHHVNNQQRPTATVLWASKLHNWLFLLGV